MVTYNHEKFIGQAIESVLMQKTAFSYELVIGEDCSPDRTRAIVTEFHRRHPSVIRPLLRDHNLGGIDNYVETLRACKGQYVAILDGDDYWTSPDKLQKQVDFLDSHPGYAICYHDVLGFYEDGSLEPRPLSPRLKHISTLADLLLVSPPSCSVMYRRGLFSDFPDWFCTLEIGDWPLHIMNARHGRIGYIDEVMAARRKHGGGVYSSVGKLARLKAKVQVYDCLDGYLGSRYRGIVRGMRSRCYHRMALESERVGEAAKARGYARKALLVRPFNKYVAARQLAGTCVRLHSPAVYKLIRSVARLAGASRPTAVS
jgi:glycosyltransferase involved in cell wall biosynthesis